jgi:septal ring factor EnvC (AmiA/AmiB activator)
MKRLLPQALTVLAVLVGMTSASVGTGSAGQIEDKRAEAARVAAALDAGGRQIAALSRQSNRARMELSATEAALATSTAEAGAADNRLHQTQARVRDQAVEAYIHGASAGLLAQLINSRGPDLGVRKQYASLAAGDDRQVIDDLRAARQDLAARKASLRRLQGARAGVVSQLNAKTAAISRAADSQRALLGRVQGELATLVAADQARRDAEVAAAARLAADARASRSRGPASWPGAPPGWTPLGGVWACIRQMESGDNYSSPGGGAYQFLDSTWHSLGQSGTASDAPPWVQDAMAVALQQRSGWSQWTTAPLCGR